MSDRDRVVRNRDIGQHKALTGAICMAELLLLLILRISGCLTIEVLDL